MKHLLLVSIICASFKVTASHAVEPEIAPEPERCSEAWFDSLIDEAAEAGEKLDALKGSIGQNPSEDESFEITMADADSAAAHADAFAARRECAAEASREGL